MITIDVHSDIKSITKQWWQEANRPTPSSGSILSAPETTPFMEQNYWQALEDSRAIGTHVGWHPIHLVAHENDQVLAWMPLFLKSHQQGEFVFDHVWAQAYHQYQVPYFPRLVTCVPFTPVTGPRIMWSPTLTVAQQNQILLKLLSMIESLGHSFGASSWHGLFFEKNQRDALLNQQTFPLVERTQCQFFWQNQQYTNFNDFLSALTAKRRKNIVQERRKLENSNIRCEWIEGSEISPDQWHFFYHCYANTYHVRQQTPYLPYSFFEHIATKNPDQILLIMAHQQGEALGSALFFKNATTLYGRYWGSIRDTPLLHFEVCYYQGIEYAIKHQLQWFDPGTQGEHKLLRGFDPILSHSLHWIADDRFRPGILRYCQQERLATEQYLAQAQTISAYRTVSAKHS